MLLKPVCMLRLWPESHPHSPRCLGGVTLPTYGRRLLFGFFRCFFSIKGLPPFSSCRLFWQCLKSSERSFQQIGYTPPFKAPERFDCLSNGLQVVLASIPLIAGKDDWIALVSEVHGYAPVNWLREVCVWITISLCRNIATDNAVATPKPSHLCQDSIS